MAPNGERGTLDLLIMVQAYEVEVVTYHGGFVGLKGSGLRALPEEVWQLLEEHEQALGRMITPSPPPARQRGRART
jgi:hypothetical protein